MEKIYTYDNGVIIINKPTNEQLIRIQQATEDFARKLMKENLLDGYVDQSRNIRKKHILDQ